MIHVPKVSIGMPIYNGESSVRRALDSLLTQTFIDYEIIISDNASTDNTEAICKEYVSRDDRILYIRQPFNRGPLANFEIVLSHARGEYFMWAAHDDEWHPNFVEVCYKKLVGNPEIGLVAPLTKALNPDYSEAKVKTVPKIINWSRFWAAFCFLFMSHWEYNKADLYYGMFRRQILNRWISKQPELEIDIGQDTLFLLEFICRENVLVLFEELRTRHSKYFFSFPLSRHLKRLLRLLLQRTRNSASIKTYVSYSNEIIDECFDGTSRAILLVMSRIYGWRLKSIL